VDRDFALELRQRGILPSAQRVAVAKYVLTTDRHPSADQVWKAVERAFPMISRATVYNTLHLFVEKGLLRELYISEGIVVFDPNLAPHHHLVDEATGAIHDVPWKNVQISRVKSPAGFELTDYQLVMRGRRRRTAR
jgi:Fe2+ or Zn2+ uptake regulation protein